MAISDLLPKKTMPSRTIAKSINDQLDYEKNEIKTRGGELISSYMCSPESAAEEFIMSKQLYEMTTGRSQPKNRDIIMYRIIQSFRPGEIEPELANKIGYELAMAFTKGRHQFIVSTHIDKSHIHTHIEFNSTNLDCDGKFNNYKNSSLALRKLSDELCRKYGLSVIENPKSRGQRFAEKAAAKHGRSFKECLRQTIDKVLPGCGDYEELLARMRKAGYEVRTGKHVAFRASGQQYFTKSKTLGSAYTEAALREQIAGAHGKAIRKKRPRQADGKKVNLLIDIQAKMQEGKGGGYERWAKLFNIKEAAKTLNFLTDSGITDYDELAAKVEEAGDQFDAFSLRVKQIEGRMAELAQLKTQIINYSKTREIYAAYKKSRHKKEFLAEHGSEIQTHEAAKAAFDALKGAPIPKVAQLSEEYTALLNEKKRQYEGFKSARAKMIEYKTAKQNVDRILGIEDTTPLGNRFKQER